MEARRTVGLSRQLGRTARTMLIGKRGDARTAIATVEAALDDANVERFSRMVRELAGDSQMIIVTHNKQTMELADRMYGVTMGEAGVSSLISAELTAKERELEPAIA